MNRSASIIAIVVLFGACDGSARYPVDRSVSPESALAAAMTSLHRRDLVGYFDSLTGTAVRRQLSNSTGICYSSMDPKIQKFGYEPSLGCDRLLYEYGWRREVIDRAADRTAAWRESVHAIQQPRDLAAKLEHMHRANNSGSSFVFSYLDPVKILHIEVDGDSAVATVDWSGEIQSVLFERDVTRWRMDPSPNVQ